MALLKDMISKGFYVDDPEVLFEWNSDINYYVSNTKIEPNRVTDNYYTLEGTVFNNTITCNIGIHCIKDKIMRIELFRGKEFYHTQSIHESFNEFQEKTENVFGKANHVKKGKNGFYNYSWDVGRIKISHYVYERFALEEHLEFRNS